MTKYKNNLLIKISVILLLAVMILLSTFFSVGSVSAEVKATVDLSGVMFNDEVFVYDEQRHSIFAINVPNVVTVTYEGNSVLELGAHVVTATFTVKEEYQNIYDSTPQKKYALLIIKQDIVEVKDDAGDIQVTVKNSNGITKDAIAKLSVIEEKTVISKARKLVKGVDADGLGVIQVINVEVLKNGEPQTLIGTSTVKIRLNEGYANNTYKLMKMNADGTAKLINCEINNGYITFDDTSLGNYALLGTGAVGFDTDLIIIIIGSVIGGLLLGGITTMIVLRKRKTQQ